MHLLNKCVANLSVRCRLFTYKCADLVLSQYNPVLSALQKSCPPVGELLGDPAVMFWDPVRLSDIKWNFEKFLVGPDGKPVMRWHPSVRVSEVQDYIRKYLVALYTEEIFN